MLQFNLNPFPILYTDRCYLRPLHISDAEDLYFLRTDAVVLQFIDREKAANIKEVENLIKRIQVEVANNEAITWAISLRHTEKLIGYIGFWRVQKEHYRSEVGYVLHPDYWRQGIMSEVLPAVIRFGFDHLKFHSIEATVNPNNNGSIALLKKQGFQQEAYFKENYFFKGKFMDTAIFSLLSDSTTTANDR